MNVVQVREIQLKDITGFMQNKEKEWQEYLSSFLCIDTCINKK